MEYFLVTAAHTGHGAEKVRHGPFSSRAVAESAAIAALRSAVFGQVAIEKDERDEDEEDGDKEDED